MAEEDEAPSWWTPANMLDQVEGAIRVLYPDGGNADPVMQAEVLLCILLPELRGVLRDVGLDVPVAGPNSTSKAATPPWSREAITSRLGRTP